MAKRNKSWAPYAIDEILKTIDNEPKTAKKSKSSKQPVKSVIVDTKDGFNFFKKIQPETVNDLAVHSKKIAEVSSWLENFVLKPKEAASFLLINGPSGCGKLSTVRLLCKQLSINITEWFNPVNLPHFSEDFSDYNYSSQTSKFIEFMVESSFGSLMATTKKNICIVKDIPHLLLRNPEEFASALENISQYSNVSVIFIVTDDSNVSTSIQRNLFTDNLKAKLNIATISFNSCAVTLMKGAINRAQKLIQANLDIFKKPSDDVLEAICTGSLGDIRCCMNQLYFAALKGSSAGTMPINIETSINPTAKRKRVTRKVTLRNQLKDETLGLFHCVGRVLNPKFAPVTNRISQNIEVIMDEFSTQPSVFLSFLHENYVKYFGGMGDVTIAAEALSLSQTYMENWIGRHETLMTAIYVAVVTLMLNNKDKINAFIPIRGPRKIIRQRAKIPIANMQFASSVDLCYYNSLVNGEKFHRFSFLSK